MDTPPIKSMKACSGKGIEGGSQDLAPAATLPPESTVIIIAMIIIAGAPCGGNIFVVSIQRGENQGDRPDSRVTRLRKNQMFIILTLHSCSLPTNKLV